MSTQGNGQGSAPPGRGGDPTEDPQVERHLKLYRHQWIGVPLIVLLPALAVVGVLDNRSTEVQAHGRGVEVTVRYPTRLRYRQSDRLEVEVKNTSAAPLDTVRVAFTPEYLDAFSDVTITPSPKKAYEVELTDVGAGETRLVDADLHADRSGRHRGTISVTPARGGDAARAQVGTFILP